MYAIKKNDMTLYFSQCTRIPHNLILKGFVLDNKPDTMFTKGILSDTLQTADYTYIPIQDYILSKVVEEGTKQLNAFINDNQGNTNFYYDCKANRNILFDTNLGKMIALTPDKNNNYHIIPKAQVVNENYEDVFKGIITLHLNAKKCVFDFIDNNFFITEYFNDKSNSVLDVLFTRSELYLQLARKQHELGFASPAFNEIVKLNEFLEHRKSIQVHLKNGEQFTIKKGTSYNSFLDASNVLSFYNNTNRFYIRKYSQYIKSSLEKDIDVNEIDYLQYHQRKHTINVYNLEDII